MSFERRSRSARARGDREGGGEVCLEGGADLGIAAPKREDHDVPAKTRVASFVTRERREL